MCIKKPNDQPCSLRCLCPLCCLEIWYIKAGRAVLPIRIISCTNFSLVISALMDTTLSDIYTTSLMIVNVSDISLACPSFIRCSRFAYRGDPSLGGIIRGWDFWIPSHVARLMLPWSITPLFLITIEPQTGVSQHSSNHLYRNLRDIWSMSGDVMYKAKLPLNPLR